MAFLTACGMRTNNVPVVVPPPVVYMQHIDVPVLQGKTNADLLAWAIDLRSALQQANNDKAAMRKWLETAGQ